MPLPQPSSSSLLAGIGLELWIDGGVTHGRAELGPATWAAGTQRPRLGLIATMADIVAGMPATGALTPTVDLSIQLMAPVPSHGLVHLVCHPAKVGRQLFIGEVAIDVDGTPIARSLVTFLNRKMPGFGPEGFGPRNGPRATTSIDEALSARPRDDRTLLVDRTDLITNGPVGTVQGGMQATIAEITSEWALARSGAFAVTDLDIRYLSRIQEGPVVATADVVSMDGAIAYVRVALTDAADPERLSATVWTVCRRVPD